MSPIILILTTRNLNSAPRVYREIKALQDSYRIICVGTEAPSSSLGVEFISSDHLAPSPVERLINIVRRLLLFPPIINSFSKRLSELDKIVADLSPQIVISHEPHYLPFLANLKTRHQFKIVYNAHEYHPLEFSDRVLWRIFWKPYYEWIYRNYLNSVDLFINVCDSIAKKCYSEFGKDSIVIPNASVFHDLSPSETDDRQIRIIHHGGCIPSRKIEVMIEVARLLGDGYQLDLMLTLTEGAYYESIKKLVSETPNVKLIPAVKFDQIVPFTNQYDIGLFLLPPTNYNYSVALPNKLFEFIQARLCVAIGPSPEMMNYVNTYDLGVVSKDFTAGSMATAIRCIGVSTIQTFKHNSDRSAKKLSAETFNKLFTDSVNEIKKN